MIQQHPSASNGTHLFKFPGWLFDGDRMGRAADSKALYSQLSRNVAAEFGRAQKVGGRDFAPFFLTTMAIGEAG